MRVAVIETVPFGGLLHYAVQLGDALAAGGEEVDLIVPVENELAQLSGPARRLAILPGRPAPSGSAPSGRPAPSGGPEPASSRLGLFSRRARTAVQRVGAWARIVRQVRRGRYDAVILNGSIDLWLTALGAGMLISLSGRAKVTHVCHNVRPFNRWGSEELFSSSPLLHALLRRVYPGFDLVFVHGERSLKEFEGVWPGARLAVIPHGDERLFAGEPPPPASEPRALFFGDWRKVKGLAVLMAAFDEVLATMPEARLTIAGDPSPEEGQADAVLAWAAQRGESVETIAGYVPVEDVAGLFARARIVVLPYLVGYQSGVLHVAMTMARAVVASDVGDLGAMVVPGETGLLVAPGDAAALAQAIVSLLADAPLAERMGEAGHHQLGERAGWAEVAARVGAALQGYPPS